MLKGFRDFLLRGNVVDLAVAVVVGAAFSQIVTALSKDIITPAIGIIGGTPDFSSYKYSINGSELLLGDFINAIVSFLITASVIYFFIVVPMNRLSARLKRNEKIDPTDRPCPECLSEIPLKAKRCKFCTAIIKK
jgi:large conductance mechanosensitive channel